MRQMSSMFASRRLVFFLKLLVVAVLVITLVLSYIAYKKHSDWWMKEQEWIDWLQEQKMQASKTFPPKKKVPGIIDLKKPLILINETMTERQVEDRFFKYIESKDVKCMDSLRLGSQHEGGYNVCMSPPFGLTPPCYVFSFGIHGDWNFDDSVSQIYKCTVYAYDPKDTSKYTSCHSSEYIVFGYTERKTPISYLKFDIEFDEWRSLRQMFRENSLKNIKQIGFEMHTNELNKKITTKDDYIKMYNTLRGLERRGFRRYDHRNNPFGAFDSKITKLKRSCCYELFYINTNFMRNDTKDSENVRQTGSDIGL